MRFLDQILPYAATLVVLAGVTATGPAVARDSGDVFSSRKRYAGMSAQQPGRDPSYGEVEFEIRSADPAQPLTAFSTNIGYGSIDPRRSKWKWVGSRELTRSGNRVLVLIPKRKGSYLDSVDLSVMQGNAFVGTVRLSVSLADRPNNVVPLSLNGQPIELEGIESGSFQIIPRLSHDMAWRLSGVFLPHREGSRTF